MPAPVNKPLDLPLGLPREPAIQPLLLRWTSLFSSVQEFQLLSSEVLHRLRKKVETPAPAEQTAELYLLLAEAERRNQHLHAAEEALSHALELLPNQWLGYHIHLLLLEEKGHYTRATELVNKLLRNHETLQVPVWDTLPAQDTLLLHRARLACLNSQWKEATDAFRTCYPQMRNAPQDVLRTWFILSLYTDDRKEAFQVAYHLIQSVSVETADALLQVLSLHRWIEEAARLYEILYRQYPDNHLLRRRLLALYIRLEELDKARELAQKGSVFHAA